MKRPLIPIVPRSAFLTLLLAVMLAATARSASLADLTRRYARDDQRLAGSLRYEREKDGVHEQVWVLETGGVLKVAVETHGVASDTVDEFSLDDGGDVYFLFRKVTTRPAGGGASVTEERSYFDDFQVIQKSRRVAEFPGGVVVEFPAKNPSVKLDLTKLADAERNSDAANQKAVAVTESARKPEFLVDDPAKNAPAEWQRTKLVNGSLSPDGRYALAWAPAKKDFVWADYKGEDSSDDYWIHPEGEAVVNFIADLKTHRMAGTTTGVHFGVRQNYNHYECIMAWSPDSRIFIELNTEKWNYAACCIGRITDGKLDSVMGIGAAVEAHAKKFLKTSKHPGYRRHAEEMLVALAAPAIQNDGNGSIDVVLQVPKSEDDDAYATVRVAFRLTDDKNALEISGSRLLKEE